MCHETYLKWTGRSQRASNWNYLHLGSGADTPAPAVGTQLEPPAATAKACAARSPDWDRFHFYIPYVALDVVAKIRWSHKNSRKNATLQRIDRTHEPWVRSIVETYPPPARRTPTQRGD